MGQISQTSMKTGLGMNAIPVFTDAQAVNVSAADFIWKVNGVKPTLHVDAPLPYEETETTGIPAYLPFKLKVSVGCTLLVVLDGQNPAGAGTVLYFNEGENNQMVIIVKNDAGNTITGATTGDITAYR